jgi:hypothetical protein
LSHPDPNIAVQFQTTKAKGITALTDFSPKFQKIQKNPNWVDLTEYHVLGFICTQNWIFECF